jgi:hypothetical protein
VASRVSEHEAVVGVRLEVVLCRAGCEHAGRGRLQVIDEEVEMVSSPSRKAPCSVSTNLVPSGIWSLDRHQRHGHPLTVDAYVTNAGADVCRKSQLAE